MRAMISVGRVMEWVEADNGRRVYVQASPTGRSVRVWVDGTEVPR